MLVSIFIIIIIIMSRGGIDAAIGLMEGAYFTGRREILQWFNELLDLNLHKIEETASGAVACQIMDYMFPGTVAMSRVNWEARVDHEFVQNYKVLQAAFDRNNVQRHIDVDKLIKAKYQDNLEFCQWLKAFFEHVGQPRDNYDPVAARSKGKGAAKLARSGGAKKAPQRTTTLSSSRRPVTTAPSRTTTRKATSPKPASKAAASSAPKAAPPKAAAPAASLAPAPPASSAAADAALIKKNAALSEKITELEDIVVGIERERDFYFDKLRDVEVMLQAHDERPEEDRDFSYLINNVFRVLYATTEEPVMVNDDGDIVEGKQPTTAAGVSPFQNEMAQEAEKILAEEFGDDLLTD